MRHLRLKKCFFISLAAFGSESALASSTAFVYSAANQFGVVNISTGAYSQIGTPDVLLSSITSLNGQTVYGLDNSFNLVTIDPATAHTSLIGNLGFPLLGIEAGPSGALYGQTGTSFYSINTKSGAASLIGNFGPNLAFDFAVGAFDSAGNLFEAGAPTETNTTSLFKVNISTGAGKLIGSDQIPVESILFQNGTLYGFTGLPGSLAAGPIVSLNLSSGLATAVAQQDPALSVVLGAGATSGSVPEPSAAFLLASGILALGFHHFRRSHYRTSLTLTAPQDRRSVTCSGNTVS